MKKFYSLVAVAALSLTAQAQETFNYELSAQGFANAQDITAGNIIPGKITYQALANGASNTPKYYNTGTNVRLYSSNGDGNGNSYAVMAAGDVKFTTVKFKADSFSNNQYAPNTAIITVDGNVVPTVKDSSDASIYVVNVANPATNITIKNGQTGTSAQIRLQSVEITYTEGTLGTIDYTEASKAVANTLWTNTASFNVKDQANVEVYNINGQLVKSFQVKGTQTVNVSDLVKGVYVVKTTSNGKTSTQKVVKK